MAKPKMAKSVRNLSMSKEESYFVASVTSKVVLPRCVSFLCFVVSLLYILDLLKLEVDRENKSEKP